MPHGTRGKIFWPPSIGLVLIQAQFDDEVRTRAVTMSLVHDMGEALIGDITPSDGVSKGHLSLGIDGLFLTETEQKFAREEMALKFLACSVRSWNSDFADSILDLWYEYERGESAAAILVRQVDKLECIQQASVYEKRCGMDLGDFMQLKSRITLPVWQPLLNECLYEHEKLSRRAKIRPTIIFVSGRFSDQSGT